MRSLIPSLMVLAAATPVTASAVHAGLLGTLDPFEGAALPEAIIGAVVLAGAIAALRWWPGSWSFAFGATLFGIVGTVVGLHFTLPGDHPETSSIT
jgi:hypothetical protein